MSIATTPMHTKRQLRAKRTGTYGRSARYTLDNLYKTTAQKVPLVCHHHELTFCSLQLSATKFSFYLAVNTLCLNYKDFCKPSFDLRTPRISVMMMMMMMMMIIIIIIIIKKPRKF